MRTNDAEYTTSSIVEKLAIRWPGLFVMGVGGKSGSDTGKGYREGQEDQLGALGLVTNAVILWNTIYMQAALDHIRDQGGVVLDADVARTAPLPIGHINMLGQYPFTLSEKVSRGELRPLNDED